MTFNRSSKKKTTVEKMVYAIFAVVAILITVQIGLVVWGASEIITSVQDSGGVKEALIDLAKDAKDIKDAFNEQ
ncbi:hypothetical protein vBVpaMR16F_37 [Vibrio phage vB_VpaM_R16F]|nr:hypothetical protein vBVpaMR16F_37 [Vibrio phage vB_VpaM_R16F]